MDSRTILAAAIVFATLVTAWMFRYETTRVGVHQNRFTGAMCLANEECWFKSTMVF